MCQIRNHQTLICKSFSNWEWIWRRSQHSCVTKTIDRLHRISKSCSVYKAIHFGRLTLQMFHFQFGFLWCLHSGTALIFGNQLRVKDRKIIWISVFTQKHIQWRRLGMPMWRKSSAVLFYFMLFFLFGSPLEREYALRLRSISPVGHVLLPFMHMWMITSTQDQITDFCAIVICLTI